MQYAECSAELHRRDTFEKQLPNVCKDERRRKANKNVSKLMCTHIMGLICTVKGSPSLAYHIYKDVLGVFSFKLKIKDSRESIWTWLESWCKQCALRKHNVQKSGPIIHDLYDVWPGLSSNERKDAESSGKLVWELISLTCTESHLVVLPKEEFRFSEEF